MGCSESSRRAGFPRIGATSPVSLNMVKTTQTVASVDRGPRCDESWMGLMRRGARAGARTCSALTSLQSGTTLTSHTTRATCASLLASAVADAVSLIRTSSQKKEVSPTVQVLPLAQDNWGVNEVVCHAGRRTFFFFLAARMLSYSFLSLSTNLPA